jgi:hypothetical protein
MYIWCQNYQVGKKDGKLTHEKPAKTLGNDVGKHALNEVGGYCRFWEWSVWSCIFGAKITKWAKKMSDEVAQNRPKLSQMMWTNIP